MGTPYGYGSGSEESRLYSASPSGATSFVQTKVYLNLVTCREQYVSRSEPMKSLE